MSVPPRPGKGGGNFTDPVAPESNETFAIKIDRGDGPLRHADPALIATALEYLVQKLPDYKDLLEGLRANAHNARAPVNANGGAA